MNAASLNETLALGAMTGMRSMAGAATLSLGRHSILKHLIAVMVAGEMVADKTTLVGDRGDSLPLAGRALMGALVGGVAAAERRGPIVLGGLVGASTAVVVAHLAFRMRRRFASSPLLGGLVEDAVVIGIGALYARHSRGVATTPLRAERC
jgi:hypothetical protein